jgi:hypothetical protein
MESQGKSKYPALVRIAEFAVIFLLVLALTPVNAYVRRRGRRAQILFSAFLGSPLLYYVWPLPLATGVNPPASQPPLTCGFKLTHYR